jgi:pyruvate/2-oxoglutarate dehydrogenase complex dihydrolipoamide dehydrogenase (E3) component
VGVGYIGMEMADALTHRGIEVELIGRSDSVLRTVDPAIAAHIREELQKHGVRMRTGVAIDEVRRRDGRLDLDGRAGFSTTADLAVWATGVVAGSGLAILAGVNSGLRGACKVSRCMETNLVDVYAAGDCVETWHRVFQRY